MRRRFATSFCEYLVPASQSPQNGVRHFFVASFYYPCQWLLPNPRPAHQDYFSLSTTSPKVALPILNGVESFVRAYFVRFPASC